MNTSTVTTERQDIHKIIDTLSDDAIKKLIGQAKLLRDEQEVAALKAKYGTTPNAETVAAMMEAESGGGEEFSSIEELMADLHDENDD
ncbi:MAG: hypothetical protein LBF92_03270 [Synergistaceae bacterium]|nr:hypothetical protein [Synergistaceae bacterium]